MLRTMTIATTSTRMRSRLYNHDKNCYVSQIKLLFQVYRVNRRSGQVEFGMVVENSELYSSDEEESNEPQQQDQRGRQRKSRRDDGDDDDDSRLKKGFVRVAWYPKGDEQVRNSIVWFSLHISHWHFAV